MKNSIGSLAALVAFAAPAVAGLPPAPVAADFNHVAVSLSESTHIDFDIDGDNTNDFYVYGNFGSGLRIVAYSPTTFSSTTFGSFFSTSSGLSTVAVVFANQTAYYGFDFVTGGQTHAGWVLFDTNSSAPEVVGGGWQATSGASVLVGSPTPPAAVPEPSSFALLAGAAAMGGALVSRRRRATPPSKSA